MAIDLSAAYEQLQGQKAAADLTLEEVLTSPEWMGLTTATPLQRAICRIADGLPIDDLVMQPVLANPEDYPPDVAERATWEWAIGEWHGDWYPREVILPSAIRGGKSKVSIARGLQMSQTCDMSFLPGGEMPRFAVVSTSKKNAEAAYEHLQIAIRDSPLIASLVVGEPRKESTILRHPTGRLFEIAIVAGSRAGSSLVSRWMAGVIFDEATRMLSSEEGVINVDEQRKAVRARLMPGAQIWYPGSPYAPLGFVYEQTNKYWQNPRDGVVVVRAVGPALNPFFSWLPERAWELKSSPSQSDQDTYWTDCLAEFGALERGWVHPAVLGRCVRRDQVTLPANERVHYVACMDPATKGNAWTLSIAGLYPDGVRRQALATQWLPEGGKPLDSREVMAEIGEWLTAYNCASVISDQWADTILQERAQEAGFTLLIEPATGPSNTKEATSLADLIDTGTCELAPVEHLENDIKRAKKLATATGPKLVLPVTADGRHCDYFPVTARSLSKAIYEPEPEEEPIPDAYAGWSPAELADLERYRRQDSGMHEDEWRTHD